MVLKKEHLTSQIRNLYGQWLTQPPFLLDQFLDLFVGACALTALYQHIVQGRANLTECRRVVTDVFGLSSNMIMMNWKAGACYKPFSLLLTPLLAWDKRGISRQ
jgi:hypothetical protein